MKRSVKTVIPSKNLPGYKAKTVGAKVKKLKANITALTDQMDGLSKYVDAGVKKFNPIFSDVKEKLDNMSELNETESLRLQMAMDRLSKMMTTLSNLLKKLSDTQQSITQNMK